MEAGAFGPEPPLVLKLELLQHTGSFKTRGAFNKMLASDVPAAGVVAASGGNFGLAVAYAARQLGHRAEIFVPDTSPDAKRSKASRVSEPTYASSRATTTRRRSWRPHARPRPGRSPCTRTISRRSSRVPGRLGLELAEQVPDADTVLVAVGGGGLIAGVASWFRGDVGVVGVEPEACPTLHAAIEAGEPVDVDVGGLAADSLGPRRVGETAFAAAGAWVERVVLVSDEAIREAQRRLWRDAHIVAEPGGAASLAALISPARIVPPRASVSSSSCAARTPIRPR